MRILVILPRLFTALGAICLAIALWVHEGERRFIRNAERTSGTVIEVERRSGEDGASYYPIIRFTARTGENITFRSNTGSNPPSHQVGDRLDVLYDPADPQHAKTSGFFALHIASFVLTLFAAIWGAIGGIWWWLQARARRLEEDLRQTGRRIQAKVREIEYRRSISVNRRHPWRIIAEAPGASADDPTVYKSANIWDDPTPYVGQTVDVLVDPYDAKRYVVDLGFLPRRS